MVVVGRWTLQVRATKESEELTCATASEEEREIHGQNQVGS